MGFDDDIFINKEISQKESDLLMKLSDTIIVTHAGLKSKLPVQQQEKPIYYQPQMVIFLI